MDFGSFWGLTVPQLLVTDMDIGTFRSACGILNNYHDEYKLKDLLWEIDNLKAFLDNISLEYESADMRKIARKVKLSEAYYNEGKPCQERMLLSRNEISVYKEMLSKAKKSVPSRLNINGDVIELSEPCIAILNYFVDIKNFLNTYSSNIKLNATSEVVVFERKLEDIIYGNPDAIKHNFINRVKSAGDFKVTLNNVLDNIRRDINKLEPLIKEHQETTSTKVNITVRNGIVKDSTNMVSPEYYPLIFKLDEVGILGGLDFSTLTTLMDLYKVAQSMTCSFYNSQFNLHLTDSEYESVFDELDNIGLVGLNLHAVDFFFNSLSSTLFAKPIEFTIDKNSLLAVNIDEISRALDGRKEYGEEI